MVAETVQEASNLQSDHDSISDNITIFDHNDWSWNNKSNMNFKNPKNYNLTYSVKAKRGGLKV